MKEIEKMRNQMHDIYAQNQSFQGTTLEVSQQLDLLIVEEMRMKLQAKFNEEKVEKTSQQSDR